LRIKQATCDVLTWLMNAWAAIRISPYSVIPELITIETIGEYSILNRLVRDCVSTCLDTLYSDVRWTAAADTRITIFVMFFNFSDIV
jgi:hypothetical protein